MNEQIKPDWDLTAKYLAGEANENEQDKLNSWLKVDHENENELGKINDAWTLSGRKKVLFKIDEDSAWNSIKSQIAGGVRHDSEKNNVRFFTRRFARMAAGFLLLAAIATGLYMITGKLHSPSGLVSVLNEESQPLTVNLSDGTVVSLNKDARLEYPQKLNGNLREVNLSGEAFFEVKPDASKPFIVHTQNASIKVVGTSFNVEAYNHSGEVKVVVETGKVELQPSFKGAQIILLEKGNIGSYHTNEASAIKGKNENINFLSWKTRIMRFENTPLQEVTSILNKTYHADINLSGENLRNCKFTGTFSDESLDTVIRVLKTAFNLKIDTHSKKILFSGKGC